MFASSHSKSDLIVHSEKPYAICEPAPRAALKPGSTVLRGYAIATARSHARRRFDQWRAKLDAGRVGAEPRGAVELAVLDCHG